MPQYFNSRRVKQNVHVKFCFAHFTVIYEPFVTAGSMINTCIRKLTDFVRVIFIVIEQKNIYKDSRANV
jgi:hypothetical protein